VTCGLVVEGSGEPIAGAAGVSVAATGAPVLGDGPSPGVAAGPGAPSEQVQFHTHVQPERVETFGASTHAPFQFHTQVQVSGAPDASAESGPVLAAGVDAPPPSADAAGVDAPVSLTVAAGAETVVLETLTPGAVTVSPSTVTPGALTLSPPALAGELCVLAGLCCVGVAEAAGVDAPSCVAVAAGVDTLCCVAAAAGVEAPPSLDAVPLAAAPPAVFVCVTAPSSPALFTRTETLTLAGPAWAPPAVALTPPGALTPSVETLAPPAALAPALLACVTVPFSPGLSTRTETFTLAGCACCAMAAPEAAAAAAEASSARAAGAQMSTTSPSRIPSGSTRRNGSKAPAIAHFMPPDGARDPCNHR
jgi:hypothetical protein